MTHQQLKQELNQLPFGKRLPTAVYLLAEEAVGVSLGLKDLVAGLRGRFEIPAAFNVLKLRTDEFKISFLAYPRFMTDAHPTLAESITIDLVSGKSRHNDYRKNSNPPILHRKELFIPDDHPKRALFSRLSKEEEEAGLYVQTRTIGFKLNWENLLAEKGLRLKGHRLERLEDEAAQGGASQRAKELQVDRHKTALVRSDLSKPVKTLLEYGVLKRGTTVFDYGCGLGTDVEGLRALGYDTNGWDPVYRPDAEKVEADVVNLGFVLNVIEDPAERLEALVSANRLAKRLLVVSALVRHTVDVETADRLQDGVLTKINTFQKFFEQNELQHYVEDALEGTAIPVALGVFYVFRDPIDQQDFLAARSRRGIDWTRINARLASLAKASKETKNELFYREHQDIFDGYWRELLTRGRRPLATEFELWSDMRERIGPPGQVERFLFSRNSDSDYVAAQSARSDDLRVYLAKANLKKKVPFSHLSPGLREDVKCFFGKYPLALQQGRELLFATGDIDEIELACETLNIGWQDEQALYLHRDLLNDLPPILRAFVGCAEVLYGDAHQADLLKLHRASGKVTFLVYDDCQNKPLPELQERIKVNLRTGWTEVFDHSGQGQLLYFKERFFAASHQDQPKWLRFSKKLRAFGLEPANPAEGPTKRRLLDYLDTKGIGRRSFGFRKSD